MSEFDEVSRIMDGRVSVKFPIRNVSRSGRKFLTDALADRVEVGRGRELVVEFFLWHVCQRIEPRDLHRIESRGFDPEILSTIVHTSKPLVNDFIVARLTSPAINIISREIP